MRQELPKELWYSVMAKLHVARLPLRPRMQIRLFQLQGKCIFWLFGSNNGHQNVPL